MSLILATCCVLAVLVAVFLCLYQWTLRRRKEMEHALRDSETKALHVVNTARDGIITITEEGAIETFNPAAETMFGYAAAEVKNKSISTLIPPPDRRRSKGPNYIQSTNARNLIAVRKDGSTFPVDLVLSEVTLHERRVFSAVVRDVSERRQSEEALQRERNFVNAVLNNAGALITVIDFNGRIVRFNRTCEELTDYSWGEIKGQLVWDVLARPEDRESSKAELLKLLEGPFPTQTESSWATRSGSRRRIVWAHTALQDEFGRTEHIISIGNDITEQKSLEGQLVHSQRMEAVGRLAGGLAHDFNNLLTAITGYSDLILHTIDERDPIRKDLEEVKRAGDRAAELTRQLLAFSRKQVLVTRVFDLGAVVRDMERMLRRIIGEDIELHIYAESDQSLVKADPSQMEQVILNLVVNARDAMPQGGGLTIECGTHLIRPSDPPTDPPLPPGQYVLLRVRDTGAGMDPEVLSRCFEPFFTTKEQGKGTGLGLSTVYGIIRQTAGAITVNSQLGKGTTFDILLPPAEQVVRQIESTNHNQSGSNGTETILLVEDEDEVRGFMRRVLAARGYHVLEAAGGTEAVEISESMPGPIHLLLTDVVMPKMPGPELARQLVAKRTGIKIIFVSGHAEEVINNHGVIDRAAVFLHKPVQAEQLADAVRQVLDMKARALRNRVGSRFPT